MTGVRDFTILDVGVSVSGDPSDLEYVGAFVDAYEPPRRPAAPIQVRVEARREHLPPASDAGDDSLWVHRSKHRYWDIRAVGTRAVFVRWLNRPVAVGVNGRSAQVATPAEATPEMTGEAAWHVCRSLALYSRDARMGKLLHASAVVVDGRAVLFVGDVSAGKTTLMTAAVLDHGAVPLSNDRVLVRLGTPLSAHSWPSYASFTEGTLLDRAPLAEAARAYEAGRTGHRTQTWGATLRRAYTKDVKRVYPMTWFCGTVGRRYRRSAPLGAIVISTLAARVPAPAVRWLDLDDDEQRQRLVDLLERECFDAIEPSFRPWHGLELPTGAPRAAGLVERLRADAVPVLTLTASAPDYRAHLSSALQAAA